MGAPKPPVIPEPFAKNAGVLRNVIPDTTTDPQKASYSLGFGPVTMQPVPAGGKPPLGQDMNGIFFALSSHDYYTQAGQLFQWDVDVLAAIGGYALGTLLGSTDGATVWFNILVNNTTNPDDDATAVGWVPLFTYGQLTLNALTGGAVTLTPSQARKATIILNGALTGNLTLVLPNTFQSWLLVNNTTGNFTVTARTAGGVGVTVPQGGFSNPLGVYGNGANIYPTVSPLGVPIDQGPTPLTLVERNNVGDAFVRYVNSNGAPLSGTVAFVITDQNDGYFQRTPLGYFESVMALQGIGGQIQPSQIVASAVTQFSPLILASAALTGTPTAPTAAPGTSNAQVATTAFANPFSALTMPGGFRLPSGHLVQYGTCNPNGGAAIVNLATAYSSAGSYVVMAISIAGGSVATWLSAGQTNNSFTVHNSGGSSFWVAIGF